MKTIPPTHRDAILKGKVLPNMNFVEKVWALTARVPKGKVTTYGAIARALKSEGYRAVGLAMNRNPFAPKVPCHRVVGSDGKLTGFASGLPKKKRMLRKEGIAFQGDRVNLAQHLHKL